MLAIWRIDVQPILGHIEYYMARAHVLDRKDYSPAGRTLRGSIRPFALFSLLAALYLVVALSIPGAFLIAKQASFVSLIQPIVPVERSASEQLAGNPAEDEGEHPWHGPKRLRGALLQPKIVIDKIVDLLGTLLAGPTTLLERAEFNKPGVADEGRLPQAEAFSQELLGRSPPSSR
jgi:hypothetical protein